MTAFGVRFGVHDLERLETLRSLYNEIQRDKRCGHFRGPSDWVRRVPDDVKKHFFGPTPEERSRWLAVRDSTVVAIPNPSRQVGARSDFYRVFEAIETGEYDVLGCGIVSDGVAEMQIDPHSYPYGGVGPLIALAEAFGFTLLGVNEYGKYQSRAELLGGKDH